MEQLDARDAALLYGETPTTLMHLGTLAFYDQSTAPEGRVRFRDILRAVEQRAHLAKCFRRKLVSVPMNMDLPYWLEDPEFDVEFHVRHVALAKPGSWAQLCKLVARLQSFPLDQTRPLWELYVISGLNAVHGVPEGTFALYSKVHQAAVDGASGAEITAPLHDATATPEFVEPPAQNWRGEPDPAPLELMMRAYGNNLTQPFRAMQIASQTAPALRRVADWFDAERPAVGAVPRTGLNGAVTSHRAFDARMFPLSALSALRSAAEGATVNDVLLAVVGGALRRYLQARNDLPAESLVAQAPLSVRAADTDADTVAPMLVALGTQIDDPVERLAAVRDSTHASKLSADAVGARLMTDYRRYVPARLAGLAARTYAGFAGASAVPFNTVVTNVPGPQDPLYVVGARLLRTYGLGPVFDNVGVVFNTFSYCGEMTIAVTACRELVPNIGRLADCLVESCDELQAAQHRAVPADGASRV